VGESLANVLIYSIHLCLTSQNFNHFTGVDFDAKTNTNAIYRIQGDGKSWASDVDKENANFDYLMFVSHMAAPARVG